ncbi:Hypothetical predicted protein [Cloeon dipterum]|uniref:Uncharacterized protein n=1 Tax=Cloeon dipterum TaxID=197152 RepID=A0A8S1BU88_9INSE|nr:Hypothetical predicted protein [Cloeon dipterum]
MIPLRGQILYRQPLKLEGNLVGRWRAWSALAVAEANCTCATRNPPRTAGGRWSARHKTQLTPLKGVRSTEE